MPLESVLADRVLATVLFTDIVGSTKLASEMGDARWREVLNDHHAAVRADVDQFGGRVVKTIGDGFLVTFDSPARAVLCAKAVGEAAAAMDLQVRAGIHTGEVEVIGDDVGGIAVHIAARVSGLAGADEILVSSTVKELVEGSHLKFKSKGNARALKGVSGKWRLFAVEWEREPEPSRPALRRSLIPLVGRQTEIGTVRAELELAGAGSMRVVTVEGEPGIGKTRLLDEAAEAGSGLGFNVVFVGADEEVRGPFYLARTLLSAPALAAATDAAGRKVLTGAVNALSGKVEPALKGLPADDLQLHQFDRAAVAIRGAVAKKPLAIFLDDLQWADEDSLRLIRYFVRTDPSIRLFLMLAYRSDAPASFLALAVDAERLGVGRRMSLARLTQGESKEFVEQLLGGPASPKCAEALYGQSEGVPFILEELLRTFREAGSVQSIDGVWEMTLDAIRAVPSSVRSLIERKAGELPDATREVLADAAAFGRACSLGDLAAVGRILKGDAAPSPAELANLLEPAVRSGLVKELPDGARHDYAFTHDQARSVLAEAHGRPRRRLVHGAIVSLLDPEGRAPSERLTELARHAILAADREAAARYSTAAARAALDVSAADQALSIVQAALGLVEAPSDRLELVRLRDDALDALGRGGERASGLDELGRLAGEIGDPALELELMIRRSAAARTAEDFELAAELARLAQETAREREDRPAELEAALQLGQALLRAPLLESYSPPPTQIDFDPPWAAYSRALELAEALGDERTVALVKRELGVIQNGRSKGAVIREHGEMMMAGGRFALPPESSPMWEGYDEQSDIGKRLLGEALETFERLDDRAGVLSTVIALSYGHYHAGVRRGVAGVIEQIRKLRLRLRTVLTESERQVDEANMLYAVHVYARTFHYADLALERGEEAFRAARTFGYRWLEFVAAGGVARTHLELGEVEEAEAWLDKARASAMVQPTPLRARQIELWRGLARAVAGDAAGAVERLERAMNLALEQRNRPGAVEAISWLALESARLAADSGDEALRARAETWAGDALGHAQALPGQHPWTVRALAAQGLVRLAGGDDAGAGEAAIEALRLMDARMLEPVLFEVEHAAARCLASTPRAYEHARIREDLEAAAGKILDEDVRKRWLEAPLQREIASIVGEARVSPEDEGARSVDALSDRETEVLQRVARGLTNREIAEELGSTAPAVGKDLQSIFRKLGVKSRGAATTAALQAGVA